MLLDSGVEVASHAQVRRPPVTPGLPLVGSLFSLLSNPYRYLLEARERHGDIFTLDLGVTKAVVLSHPDHVQRVFVDKAPIYRKGGGFWEAIRTILGNGLPVSEGDFWMRQRRMMQPHFHRQKLAGLTGLMIEAIDEALAGWETAGPLNLSRAFNQLTMKAVTRALFGAGLTGDESAEVSEAMAHALDYVVRGIIQHALPSWVPAPGRRKHLESIERIDRVVYRFIADCRAGKGGDTLLSMLSGATDGGEGMTDVHLRDEVASMFLAGYETTSLALTWSCVYLMRQPELMARLRDEADRVLGKRLPTFEDVPKLTFARKVVQETMRLRPPAWQVTRTLTEDDRIDGYHLPAGTEVLTLIYGIQQHPDFWPDPTRYDPERFAPAEVERRHKCAWIPFGAGQRLCIGRDFALMEGQLALAMMAQRYDLRSLDRREPSPRLSSTLQPKGGVSVAVSRRS
ncbi:MAG TPA: cytochrome P450 [Myxococcaceae bacterium]|nr:cytochrome P450 [Myxococcaceae bacterium]